MDIDYNGLFGLNEGAEVQEAAEPAEPMEDEGAEEQEAADPAEEMEDPGETEDGEDDGDDDARFAAARRRAEQERDAAIRQAREEAQRTIDNAFRDSGLTNPYTKQPITSKADYDAYKAQFEKEKRDKILQQSGMTENEFDKFVDGLPQVREAREQAKAAQAQAAQVQIEKQLSEIRELDPAIQTIDDLTKMENYQRFYDLVKRGNTMVDAYKLANYDAMQQKAASKGRQEARNKAASKNHMTGTQARGTGAVSVPEDVKEQYRLLNPGVTDEEIQKHYNRYHNRN